MTILLLVRYYMPSIYVKGMIYFSFVNSRVESMYGNMYRLGWNL